MGPPGAKDRETPAPPVDNSPNNPNTPPGDKDKQNQKQLDKLQKEEQNETLFNSLKNDHSGHTVFVLNLSWTISQEQLVDYFSKFGKVKDAVHVKNFKGFSRGFAYVQFEDVSMSAVAIKELNGVEWEGRKIRVSKCHALRERKDGEADPRVVFVSALPRLDNIEQLLQDKFGGGGEIVEIRLGMDHEGKFKKIAFIEFRDEEQAKSAIALDNTPLVGGGDTEAQTEMPGEDAATGKVADPTRTKIRVATSKANKPKKTAPNLKDKMAANAPRTKKSSSAMITLVPRNVHVKQQSKANSTKSAEPSTPMTNEEFRNMFKKT